MGAHTATTEATVEHHLAQLAVVDKRCQVARARNLRRLNPAPLRAIPIPRVIERVAVYGLAAKQDQLTGGIVIGESSVGARGRCTRLALRQARKRRDWIVGVAAREGQEGQRSGQHGQNRESSHRDEDRDHQARNAAAGRP